MSEKKIAVSACLVGINCKYSGGNNRNEKVIKYLEGKEFITICPECEGGLDTPRVPSEIAEGMSGEDFIKNRKEFHVYSKEGKDVTEEFARGAEISMKKLERDSVKFAILKESSPSCGINTIYTGRFDGTKKNGMGVTAALFKSRGVKLVSEKEIELGNFLNDLED